MMNRGRGRSSGGYSTPSSSKGRSSLPHHNPLRPSDPGEVNSSTGSSIPLGSKNWKNNSGKKTFSPNLSGSNSRQYVYKPKVDNRSQQDQASPGVVDLCSKTEKLRMEQNSSERMPFTSQKSDVFCSPEPTIEKHLPSFSSPYGLKDRQSNERAHSSCTPENSTGSNSQFSGSPLVSSPCQKQGSYLTKPHINDPPTSNQKTWNEHTSLANSPPSASLEHSDTSSSLTSFDICPHKSGTGVVLKAPLFSKNRERRNESKRLMEERKGVVLRPGMVHLKNYFSCADQVKIIKKCRNLGLGAGGFYQPGYRDGAKLQLKMMCLGKNWDPEKGEYGSARPIDGAKPPAIPSEFYQFVKGAIGDSHILLEQEYKDVNAEKTLPSMTPNICIVNFYATSGRLGLHQDKDESLDSINKGLPVVSFSFGDSADFQYGDERDVDRADKVVLESGDVVIFGGKSRRIFHGVTTIHPNTAPKALLEETQLRPGRLNLTFREY